MELDFSLFKLAVAKQFETMSGSRELFCTKVSKDEMWETYLNSFPTGSNPIFRERTEHDCTCCKQFIRVMGNVVAVVDNQLVSIWDCRIADPNYQAVADAMSQLVKSAHIDNVFRHYEAKVGTSKTYEEIVGQVVPRTWEHFFVNLPQRISSNNRSFVVKKDEIGPLLSDARAVHDVFLRGLNDITHDALDSVLELIAQNSLYRGEEHRFAVNLFKDMKQKFLALPGDRRDAFVWNQIGQVPVSVSKIRGTSIGTLLLQLSEDVELEEAVKAFERIVAPENYKRPTALITPSMIAKAKQKIEELGLTSALERRYATLSDISINDVLFADRQARQRIKGSINVFDALTDEAAGKPKNWPNVEEVSIDKFLSDIMPTATSLEVMFEGDKIKNLVSLVAPVDPTAGRLFKWDNNFSWSYNGDFADSIKERVKKAGGSVEGDLCCRLAWFNYDDLDLHMHEPQNYHLYYYTRYERSPNGGCLDVDMNAQVGTTREPVENIFYVDKKKMMAGKYVLEVQNYQHRESCNPGFVVEVDIQGTVHRFVYDKSLPTKETVTVAIITYSPQTGFNIQSDLPSTQRSKQVWGVHTEKFQKVSAVMMSPNHWGGKGVGNRHYFFMLQNCINEGTARGFFNEFLKEDLSEHRKVFEVVGSKIQAESVNDQLSGLGFSSTQRESVLVKISGATSRVIKVMF